VWSVVVGLLSIFSSGFLGRETRQSSGDLTSANSDSLNRQGALEWRGILDKLPPLVVRQFLSAEVPSAAYLCRSQKDFAEAWLRRSNSEMRLLPRLVGSVATAEDR
jgi:hypothetical protein